MVHEEIHQVFHSHSIYGAANHYRTPDLGRSKPETEQQKCLEYLKKCFSSEDYEYIGDFSILSINECWVACKSTYDNDFSCDFDTCLEMCKVASGHSKNACPIPADPLE